MRKIISILLGLLMIYAGINHVLNPEFYELIMPPLLDPTLVHIVALILEVAVGLALIIPTTSSLGGLAFMALMLLFLPLHILDLFKEVSVTGSQMGSVIRLIIQFGLICVGYWIWKRK